MSKQTDETDWNDWTDFEFDWLYQLGEVVNGCIEERSRRRKETDGKTHEVRIEINFKVTIANTEMCTKSPR